MSRYSYKSQYLYLLVVFLASSMFAYSADDENNDTYESTNFDRKKIAQYAQESIAAKQSKNTKVLIYETIYESMFLVSDSEKEKKFCEDCNCICNVSITKWITINYQQLDFPPSNNEKPFKEVVSDLTQKEVSVIIPIDGVVCVTDNWMSKTAEGWILDKQVNFSKQEYIVNEAIDLLVTEYGMDSESLEEVRTKIGTENISINQQDMTVRELLSSIMLQYAQNIPYSITYRVTPRVQEIYKLNVLNGELQIDLSQKITKWSVLAGFM